MKLTITVEKLSNGDHSVDVQPEGYHPATHSDLHLEFLAIAFDAVLVSRRVHLGEIVPGDSPSLN